jgi:hypothetical protein
MARTMMYLFILFIVFWNLRAVGYLSGRSPTFSDRQDSDFCHPTVYWLTYVLVVTSDVFFGAAFLVWVAAIITG